MSVTHPQLIRKILEMRKDTTKNMKDIERETGVSYPTVFKYCKMLDKKIQELQEHPEQMMSKRELALLNEQKKERETQEFRKDLKDIIGSVAEELKKHGETKG